MPKLSLQKNNSSETIYAELVWDNDAHTFSNGMSAKGNV